MKAVTLATLLLLAIAGSLAAQAPPGPKGWKVLLDSAGRPVDAYRFEAMPPGFHITMGPGALLFAPTARAAGPFTMAAKFFVFPGSSEEGFGLFVGGTGLEYGEPSYTAFLVRRDGMAGVFRHDGGDSTIYLPWVRPDSVNVLAGDQPAPNTLAIVARADSVSFLVNGTAIGAVARPMIPVDGQFGYRVGKGVNVHAATLDYTWRLAPERY